MMDLMMDDGLMMDGGLMQVKRANSMIIQNI